MINIIVWVLELTAHENRNNHISTNTEKETQISVEGISNGKEVQRQHKSAILVIDADKLDKAMMMLWFINSYDTSNVDVDEKQPNIDVDEKYPNIDVDEKYPNIDVDEKQAQY